MPLPEATNLDRLHQSINKRLHKLWTLCVGSTHYDKEQWKDMDAKIYELYLAAKKLEIERDALQD
jgi:hypothetical protein